MAVPPNTPSLARARCALVVAVGSLVLATACSGESEPSDATAVVVDDSTAPDADGTPESPAAGSDATSEAVAYTITPPELPDGIVGLDERALDEENDGRFVSLVDFVRRGVELGEWTEPEGVIALLRTQLGEISRSSIEGLDLVIMHSGTSLLRLATDLADDATVPDADRDEIERLLAQLTPSAELFEELATQIGDDPQDTEPNGLRRPSVGARPAQAAECVEPRVSAFPWAGTVRVDCWKMKSQRVHRSGGSGYSQLQVVYPQAAERQAEVTMEALVTSVEAGHAWSDANADSSVLIIPATVYNDKGKVVWGVAAAVTPRLCAITIGVDSTLNAAYMQMVAHEQVHCLQYADFGDFTGADDWFIEGGAEYFSHVIYPEGGNERDTDYAFLTGSLTKPLTAMDYEAWVWWQHLSNMSSPTSVFDLHRRMTFGNPVEVLADEPGMAATFQSFTIDLRTVGVPTHGAPIESAPYAIELGRIASTGYHSHAIDRFVAARLDVSYARRHLFEQTDHTMTDGVMQMALAEERFDRSAWRGLPPEVRSSCESDVEYVMAATTTEQQPHSVEWIVDLADEYSCDPCLGGTWVVDNDSFRDTIMSFAGAGIPPGMDFSIELVGPYYVRFDGDGAGHAWRDDWQIVATGSVEGMTVRIVTTIASIETFSYGADGERFDVWNSLMLDHRTTLDFGGLPFPAGAVATPDEVVVNLFGVETTVGTTSDGAQSAGGRYTCTRTRLELALDDAPGSPIALTRVKDIPEPPIVLADE